MKTYEQRIRLIDHHMTVAHFIAHPRPVNDQVKALVERYSRLFQSLSTAEEFAQWLRSR